MFFLKSIFMKKLLLLIALLAFVRVGNAQWIDQTITFENPDTLLHFIENWPTNCFQDGVPSKVFFDSAYSAPMALVTGVSGAYPVNSLSAFTIKIFDPAWGSGGGDYGVLVSYWHKYDTDSLHDGGYILYSLDGGTSWANISDSPGHYAPFFYDPENYANPVITGGMAAYTGKSRMNNSAQAGWRNDSFRICFLGPQTAYVRFVFSSDSIPSNREGWMIDNIHVLQEICEGVPKTQTGNPFTVFPNPAREYLTLLLLKQGPVSDLSISDVMGRTWFRAGMFKGNTIDVRSMPDGIYLLQATMGDTRYTRKIMVSGH